MKIALMTFGLFLTVNAQAAIDYSYCQSALNLGEYGIGMMGGEIPAEMKGYPYTLTADGKIKPHANIKSYKEDAKARTETISFGEKPYEQKVVIVRDEAGIISKVITTSSFDAPETKSGVGAKKKNFTPGWGMGFGYPGVGLGYGMGMPMQDSRTDVVTDLKIQNGKCVPYRSLMETKTGKHLERHFLSDVQLCRDMKTFFKKNPDAEACFGTKLNAEANEVMKGHHARNADVYKPQEDKQDNDPFGGFGQYPGSLYDGGGFNNDGGAYIGLQGGGFAMYLDGLASQEPSMGQASPLARAHMIMQYCKMPFGPISKMIEDDKLFAVESTEAAAKATGVSK